MKLKKLALSATLGLALTGTGLSAQAAIMSLTNSDGTFSPFGGFDWAENGTAVVTGFNAGMNIGDTSIFTLEYFATAISVSQLGGGILIGPNLSNYEYTIHAQVQEQATCIQASGGICTLAQFEVLDGADPNFFRIYYDTGLDANQVAGTGFTNGTLIIEGFVDTPQIAGIFQVTNNGLGGTGSNSLLGTVTYTNNDFVNPDLIGTNFGSQINFGTNVTNWTAPTGTPSVGGINCTDGSVLCLQADGNQTFTSAEIPEPSALALLGLGLLGMMGISARRKL
jgi:hypothetical protein